METSTKFAKSLTKMTLMLQMTTIARLTDVRWYHDRTDSLDGATVVCIENAEFLPRKN